MNYRSEIDGLRAFAVVPVILFHAGIWPVTGGYVGVDIFFVISGYLITTLIAAALLEGRFSIIDFYERRARRILPALFVVQLACIPFAIMWMMPNQRHDFFQSLVAVNLFGSNLLFWAEDDYFGLASDLKPLLHTWSLAVEEQFYLFFPLILILMIRKGSRLPWKIAIALVVLSFALCLFVIRRDASTAFYLLPFRAWELGLGSLAAFVLMTRPDFKNEIGALAGLVAIIASIFLLDHDTLFPSEWALLPVLGTMLLILCAQKGTVTQRILSWRPFVFIGLISYSAYLWHQPLFAFARIRFDELSISVTVGLMAATFVLAVLSWRFIEQPVRRAPKRQVQKAGFILFASHQSVFLASGIVIFLLTCIGVVGDRKEGFRDSFDQINVAGFDWDNIRLQRQSWEPLRTGTSHRGPTGDVRDNLSTFQDLEATQFLTIGNSLSKDFYNALINNPDLQVGVEVARYGIWIEHLSEPNHLFWIAPNYSDADVIFFSSFYRAADIEVMPEAIARMQEDGKTVVIIGNSPRFWGNSVRNRADDIVLPALIHGTTKTFPELAEIVNAQFWADLDNDEQRERLMANRAQAELAETSGAIYLDRLDFMCIASEERCLAMDDDLTKHFYDEHHTTLQGAAFFGQRMAEIDWLAPVFEAIELHR